jgi:formate dehydrogenase
MGNDNGTAVIHFKSIGAGRRQTRPVPKGRQVDPEAEREVAALLGDRPLSRDYLIEHLHLVQDTHHQLSLRHLAALAKLMRLAFAEVYETATFYSRLDVVREGEPDRPPLTIRVCESPSCAMFGADGLRAKLQAASATGELGAAARVLPSPCFGLCDQAPTVEIGKRFVHKSTVESVKAAVAHGELGPELRPDTIDYDRYRAGGGYRLVERLLSGELTPDAVLAIMDKAVIRGLGGAGFPTGRKWHSLRATPGRKLMAVNGDEGEPGTFKDRHFLEGDPHRVLEGATIAALVTGVSEIYLYVRDEYPAAHVILAREIAKRPVHWPPIHLRRGAGAYICGEETAMLESIEGKRGTPRQKPPYPFEVGLFGHPTLIDNVETLTWVRDILEKGADWWNSFGRHGHVGQRTFSVSGRVKHPGLKLAPVGITARELIDEYCGGMVDGHTFTGYLPGGASGGILPASMADIPLDFGTLEKHGCFIGTAAVLVFSQADDIPAVAVRLARFFEDESCGHCTPCRRGTQKARMLVEAGNWDRTLLGDLADVMGDASICGLGQAAMNPISCVLRYFPEAVAAKGATK